MIKELSKRRAGLISSQTTVRVADLPRPGVRHMADRRRWRRRRLRFSRLDVADRLRPARTSQRHALRPVMDHAPNLSRREFLQGRTAPGSGIPPPGASEAVFMPARAAAPASKLARQASFHWFAPFRLSISRWRMHVLRRMPNGLPGARVQRGDAAQISPRGRHIRVLLREVRHRMPVVRRRLSRAGDPFPTAHRRSVCSGTGRGRLQRLRRVHRRLSGRRDRRERTREGDSRCLRLRATITFQAPSSRCCRQGRTTSWRAVAMRDVEIHGHEGGKIVVVIEGTSTGVMGDLSRISLLDGVIAANMVFEHVETEEAADDDRRTDAA